jgi:hypothetical protein
MTDADGGVILDLRRGSIFRCNSTGAVILELLARGCDQTEITTNFTRLSNVPPGCASADVQAFLASLARLGLLEDHTARGSVE